MKREDIRLKVLCCIDEVCEQNVININISYPIDNFLDEAAEQVLAVAPDVFIDNPIDFSLNEHIINEEEGYGSVKLPEKFLRIVKFKIKDWKRPVKYLYDSCSVPHKLQANAATRAGINKPVGVLENGFLIYYPLTSPSVVEIALAVTAIDAGDDFPERLIPALAWLTAAKTLSVMNESSAATTAMAQYNSAMNLFDNIT